MNATRDFFGEHLLNLATGNDNIVVVNCDLGEATRVMEFKKKFPERYIEAGIAEANAISIASGMSKEGLIPFVTSFGHFLTGKFLEIFQSVGLNNSNITLVGTHAGLAIGKDGPTQMGLRDIALMRLLPNVKIYQPINQNQTIDMLNEIISVNGPKYLRLNRQPQEFFKFEEKFSFGSPDQIVSGRDLLVMTQGAPTIEAFNSLKKINKNNLVGLSSISSLPINDDEYVELISKYKKVLVVEDHYKIGGISDVISRLIAENMIKVEFHTICVTDYGQSGDPSNLYKRYFLDSLSIEMKVLELLS